jgi:hypothetical protein
LSVTLIKDIAALKIDKTNLDKTVEEILKIIVKIIK